VSPRLFVVSFLLDLVIGDPRWLPHPVRVIGHAISRGETVLRHLGRGFSAGRAYEFLAGAVLTLSIVVCAAGGSALSVYLAHRYTGFGAAILTIYFATTAMATRSLLDEARAVGRLLRMDDLPAAQRQVARIVGRDTGNLDAREVVRATIETVAESACDGIVAPMFYLALGGVPAGLAYKAINTLDSMIGHNDSRYRYFGKFAARSDDVANFIPARLTALLITFAAFASGRDWKAAWRIWQRDGTQHASPNAGCPEAAMAGALGVRLGGMNFYGGEVHYGQHLGDASNPLDLRALHRSLNIVLLVSVMMFLISCSWMFGMGNR
jgi:adenosylcobinamide-phosphate synthase